MDITEFLLEKGYQIEYKTTAPKGRGKFQYFCAINKKPSDEEMMECEDKYNVKILKCNFKKGKELTILMKKREEKTEVVKTNIVDISLHDITEMIYNKNLDREDLYNKLSMFQNSAYTKGYNAHKKAWEKLLGVQSIKDEDD